MLLPVALLKALWLPSHSGNFFDCQQRHTGAFLPTTTEYGSFMGTALSPFSGAIGSAVHMEVVERRTLVEGRRRTVVALTKAIVRIQKQDGDGGGGCRITVCSGSSSEAKDKNEQDLLASEGELSVRRDRFYEVIEGGFELMYRH